MSSVSGINPASSAPPQPAASPTAAGKKGYWGKDGFTFGDIVDLVNPLQHIPVVASVYRAVTGDEASNGARVLGGALYGGVAGLLASYVEASTADSSGKGIGERTAVAALGKPSTPHPAETQIADTPPPATPHAVESAPTTHMARAADKTPPAPAATDTTTPEAELPLALPADKVNFAGLPNEPAPGFSYALPSAVPETALLPSDDTLLAPPPELPEQHKNSVDDKRRQAVQAAIERYLEAEQAMKATEQKDYDKLAADLLI